MSDGTAPNARRLGRLAEAVHAVVYFAPEPGAAYAALGLRGYWMGYFASRSAALGAAGPEEVTRLFGGFAPAKVARALPDAWSYTTPQDVLAARLGGASAALRRALGPADLRAVPLLEDCVAALDLTGRPLAAAHLTVAPADDPLGRLWQLCTVLREHRGDAHLAALAEEGLTWPEPHLLLAGLGRLDPRQQDHRGWDDGTWTAAAERLRAEGLLAGGSATAAGRALSERVEQATDRAGPRYGRSAAALAAALEPLARAACAELPFPNAMGLADPRP